jgi:hypothetical protein
VERARVPALAVLLVVITLLLAMGADPGSGTGTNLQPAADAAGLVIGAHHAKPVPASGTAVVALVLLALAAVARGTLSFAVVEAPSGRPPRPELDDRPARPVASPRVRAMRAPPALAQRAD